MSAYGYSKVFNMQTNMHMCLIVPIRKGVRAYSYKINDIIIKIIINNSVGTTQYKILVGSLDAFIFIYFLFLVLFGSTEVST